MYLRPHHLLCIQKFTGHGYDTAFTAYMTAVVGILRTQPETSVTIVQGADDLCISCPHCVSGSCDAQEKSAALDAAVSSQCALSAGDTRSWQTLAALARTQILQADAFHQICACCQWYALCRRTEADHGTGNT